MESNKNRHKHVRCKVCAKYIRSDHVKRHARTHKDILDMSEEEMREELRVRNTVQIKREEQRQKMVEIAQQENIPIEHCNDMVQSTTSILEVETLEEELLQDNREYLNKLELGSR